MYYSNLIKKIIQTRLIYKNNVSIYKNNVSIFKKNYNEESRNLHRWCLKNKNKTKREYNYPW